MLVNYPNERCNIYRVAMLLAALCLVVTLLIGCGPGETPKVEGKKLSLSSPEFQDGDKIPAKYICQGQDISPPLTWNEPPAGT